MSSEISSSSSFVRMARTHVGKFLMPLVMSGCMWMECSAGYGDRGGPIPISTIISALSGHTNRKDAEYVPMRDCDLEKLGLSLTQVCSVGLSLLGLSRLTHSH